MVHIVNAFGIFGERKKAIEMCISRFDEDTKTSFLDLYSKIDTEVVLGEETETKEGETVLETAEEKTEDHSPF